MTLFDKKAVADNMVKNHGYTRDFAERQTEMLSRLIDERMSGSNENEPEKKYTFVDGARPRKRSKPLIGDKILNRIKKRLK